MPSSGPFFLHDDRFGGDDAPAPCVANLLPIGALLRFKSAAAVLAIGCAASEHPDRQDAADARCVAMGCITPMSFAGPELRCQTGGILLQV